MTTSGERVRDTRIQQRLSQSQLAKKVPMPGTILSKIESDLIKDSKYYRLISKALKVDFDWLMTGEGFKREEDVYAGKENHFPILEGAEVLLWCLDKMSIKEIFIPERDFINNPYEKTERKRRFAFRIDDESMMTDKGISFHPGTVVIIDPDRPFKNHDYVLTLASNGVPVIYQYTIAGDIQLLKHLNPQYPMHEFTPKQSIIGVVISRLDIFY